MDELRQKLEKHGQGHLLDFWDEITEDQKETLKAELDNVDLEYTTQSFERCTQAAEDKANAGKVDDRMEPVPIDICGSVSNLDPETKKTYEKNTFEAIVKGQYAVLLLAGGQGTRLGVCYPKGMYDVGLPSNKTLFQLQAERLLKLQTLASEAMGGQQCKSGIAWYIMTSKTTIEPTRNFFEKKDYFGLKKENVRFFEQGTLPCFSFAGKILMDSKYQLARAPDGNGGLYRALKNDGILEDMKNRGIEYVQLYCVDNILVKIGDPLFTGYCIEKGAECANKVVPKGFPTEAVGITAVVDGKYQVVEYSEITKESAEKRNPDGSLTYSAANICIHYFTRKFLDRVVGEHERDLIHHVAKKKIPYMDSATGLRVTPERPNGIKMEKFVFDVFQFAEDKSFAIWECIREEEFAPLKNANGASDFTPMHCRKALFALHQKYVMKAGGYLVNDLDRKLSLLDSPATPKEVNNNLDSDEMFKGEESKVEIICEIAPSVTYAGEGLEKLVKGQRFRIPCNLPL